MNHTPGPMHIGIPMDYRSYIAGARDMLHEAAKMFRLTIGPDGHAAMCDAHKLRLNLVLRALDKGNCNAHEELVNILQKLSRLAPSSEGLGGHAPLSAFLQLASDARKALTTIEKGA